MTVQVADSQGWCGDCGAAGVRVGWMKARRRAGRDVPGVPVSGGGWELGGARRAVGLRVPGELRAMGAMEVPGVMGEQVPAVRVQEDRGLQMRGIMEVAVRGIAGGPGRGWGAGGGGAGVMGVLMMEVLVPVMGLSGRRCAGGDWSVRGAGAMGVSVVGVPVMEVPMLSVPAAPVMELW